MAHSHRSSKALKQENKKHKGPVGTRAGKAATKGRVEGRKGPKAKAGGGDDAANARTNKLNLAKQTMKQRRQEVWLTKRLGRDGAPKVVLLMGLADTVDIAAARSLILSQAQSVVEHEHGKEVAMCTAVFSQYKQRATLVSPARSLMSCLEFAKVADFVVLVVPVQHGEDGCVDEVGEQMLNCLKAQGLPSVIGVIQGLGQLNKKAAADMKKYGQRLFDTEFGDLVKTVDGDNAVQMVRVLASAPARTIHWRAQRSYFMADAAVVEPPAGDEGGGDSGCRLRVRGYIRGRPLSVNQLVCMNGAGHFKMSMISSCPEPCPLRGSGATGGAVKMGKGAASAASHSGSSNDAAMEDDTEGMPPPAFPGKPPSTHTHVGLKDVKSIADEQLVVLAVADPKLQDSLEMEAEVDHLAGEQTWPTEEEMAMAGGAMEDGHAGDAVGSPTNRGKSSYQGAWLEAIKGTSGEEEGKDKDREHVMVDDGEEAGAQDWLQEDEEEEDDGLGGEDVDDMDGGRAEKRLQERAREDMDFPDEVDTPFDKPARARFARFRHLKSFRTSSWDPKESLPRDYARIFQFHNFVAVQKKMIAESEKVEKQQNEQLLDHKAHAAGSSKAHSTRPSRSSSVVSSSSSSAAAAGHKKDDDNGDDDDDDEVMHEYHAGMEIDDGASDGGASSSSTAASAGVVRGAGVEGVVASGQYVEIVVEGVPADLLSRRQEAHGGCDWPVLLFSLLRFENKMTVLHFNVQREASLPEGTVIPSKEKLVFQVGFRRWTCKPIFSQISLNSDKHKFERFLQPGRFVGASCYGPATYQPAPLLIFRQIEGGELQLVASGSLLSVDADRIILKKVVLTGYPLRVKKRKGVVKYMFHNPDDIKWFKPCELVTKWGLTGSIREAVGTHGLFKAVFNKPIKQNDIVCLNLFKRVYPKLDDDTVVIT